MKTLVIIGGIALLGALYVGALLGYRSDCVNAEAGLKAQHQEMKNKDAQRRHVLLNMAQVDKKYDEQFKEVWEGAMSGRYGDKGSQAVFQFLQEQNPQLSTTLKERLMTAIDVRFAESASTQTAFNAKVEAYEKIWNGNRSLFVGFWFDFPTEAVTKLKIVTTSATERAFETGVDDGTNLYGP